MKTNLKIKSFMICAICLASFMMSGFAGVAAFSQDAEPQIVSMYLNGIKVTDGIKFADTTYTPIRAFAEAIGEDTNIAWDGATKTATITTADLVLTITEGQQYLTANGRCLYLPEGAINYNDSIMVPVRVIAKVFNVDIEWDSESSSISIGCDNLAALQSADEFYNEEDLYWLSRLIYSESGNQPMDGKIGVGNVVLNRVADPTCPDTIYGVIFDRKYGVQFSVTENGTIYNEPSAESVVAAKLCLEGYNVVENSLYFVNPVIGVSSWFANTRVFVASIGEHDFYA